MRRLKTPKPDLGNAWWHDDGPGAASYKWASLGNAPRIWLGLCGYCGAKNFIISKISNCLRPTCLHMIYPKLADVPVRPKPQAMAEKGPKGSNGARSQAWHEAEQMAKWSLRYSRWFGSWSLGIVVDVGLCRLLASTSIPFVDMIWPKQVGWPTVHAKHDSGFVGLESMRICFQPQLCTIQRYREPLVVWHGWGYGKPPCWLVTYLWWAIFPSHDGSLQSLDWPSCSGIGQASVKEIWSVAMEKALWCSW